MKITHRVIDLVYSEDEGNVVMNGSLKECEEFIASQETDYFTYQIEPLLKHERDFLNSYSICLTNGQNYLKTGNINSFR